MSADSMATNPPEARTPGLRPNILILHTDQQRYGSLGCTGNPHARTPSIDALAAEGTVFTRHIVANSVCMPSRATMMTGLYPPAHGVWDNGVALNRREYIDYSRVRHGEGTVVEPVTIADLCSQANYRTACFGKMHLTPFLSPADYRFPESQVWWGQDPHDLLDWHGPYYGFQHVELAFNHGQIAEGHYRVWLQQNHPEVYRRARASPPGDVIPGLHDLRPAEVPLELHPTTWLADRFVRYLRRQVTDERPFMAFVGFPDPHHPWEPTREALELFVDSDVLAPHDVEGTDWEGYVFDSAGGPLVGWTEEQKRIVRRYTLAQVYQIDLAVGAICDALQSRGLWENTLVVFTSDHGDFLGDHNFLRKGIGAANSLLHVPFMARIPWMKHAPSHVDRVMSNCDLMPTVLAQAGLDCPEYLHGRDIFQVIAGGHEHRAAVYCSRGAPASNNCSVYDDRYRYTIYPCQGREELFDHQADPGECRNLASDPAHRARCEAMRHLVKEHLLVHRNPIGGRVSAW